MSEYRRKNRYIGKQRQEFLEKRCEQLCRYKAPTDERVVEHGIVNHAIEECMKTLVSVMPETLNDNCIERMINQLWDVKNLANGALAVYSDECAPYQRIHDDNPGEFETVKT